MDSYNANKEMLLTKGQQCFDAIDAFRLHPVRSHVFQRAHANT